MSISKITFIFHPWFRDRGCLICGGHKDDHHHKWVCGQSSAAFSEQSARCAICSTAIPPSNDRIAVQFPGGGVYICKECHGSKWDKNFSQIWSRLLKNRHNLEDDMRVLGRPSEVNAVAVSGGADSMAALSFFRNANHNVVALHFNHGTEHAKGAHKFVRDYCSSLDIKLFTYQISSNSKPKDKSWEEFWRDERYAFFKSFGEARTIATAHHLSDVAETYLFTSLHGDPRTIPYRHGNVVRPFLLWPKSAMERWCAKHEVPYIMDPSNNDLAHPRNRIRHVILPEMLTINPGFFKVLAKRVFKEYGNAEVQKPKEANLSGERSRSDSDILELPVLS